MFPDSTLAVVNRQETTQTLQQAGPQPNPKESRHPKESPQSSPSHQAYTGVKCQQDQLNSKLDELHMQNTRTMRETTSIHDSGADLVGLLFQTGPLAVPLNVYQR